MFHMIVRKIFSLLSLVLSCAAMGQTITPEIEKRALELVAQMTLEEKLAYIGGYNGFFIRPIPRLGIPEIRMADGPQGVRNDTHSTMYPCGIAAAATWNRELARTYGHSLGQDARARGVHIMLGPGVNIYRSPLCGRNYEYYGEDPFLTSETAVAYIEGMQAAGVMATIKHFCGNNQEWNRHNVSSDIDERTLHEIYLPAFRKAVQKARVGAVMSSYNPVNSIHTTESRELIIDVLREKWNFKGIYMSDWTATYSTVGAANNGLDLEMSWGQFMNPDKLRTALATGTVTEETIDEKCRKILEAKQKYVLPNVYPAETPGLWSRLNSPTDIALKQQLYQAAITLIKNTDSLLPLKRLDTLRIASLNFGARAVNNFQTTLERYTQVTHFVANKKLSDEELRNLQKKLQPFNCIIIYNNLSTNSAQKDFGYSPVLDTLIRQQTGKRIILCHPGIPYGLASYVSLPTDALLLSYENHLYAQQYAAQAIFGGIAMTARLPVCVNPDYPAGTGIQTPKTRLSYTSPEMCRLDSEKLAKIDSICQLAVQAHATPGCQVLIAKDGNIFYNKAFGHHTYKQTTPNKTSDIYDLASVTKITATLPAIIKLYDSRKINLAAPLSDYYPPLKETDKKDITVQEVLCHNAGLKTFLPLFTDAIDPKSLPGPLFTSKRTAHNTTRLKDRLYVNLNYRFKDSTVSNSPKPGYKYMEPGLYMFPAYQDTIRSCILHSPLNPKKEYAYSDLGFILLKFAVEHVTEKSLDQYCQEEFYRKLGMHHTDFLAHKRLNKNNLVPSCVDKLYRKTELKGYVHDPIAALLGGIAGHAGLFSTAEDLAKMMQLYLNGGTYGGEYYFSPETMATFSCKNNLFPKNRRGLGFDKPEPDQTKINPVSKCLPLTSFGHTGFTGIMAWCDPDNKLLYLFLSNRTYPDEFNTKLSEMNIRTQIQDIIYQALEESKIRYN